MTHLYKLTERYNAILELLDTESDIIPEDEIKKSLAAIKDEFQGKVGSIGKLILELKADAVTIDNERRRLEQRKAATLGKMETLKNYLLVEMQAANILKVKEDVVTISVRNNPPSVEVANEELVPSQFIRVIPEQREVDKKSILEHFRTTGEILPGVNVIVNKKYLEVR